MMQRPSRDQMIATLQQNIGQSGIATSAYNVDIPYWREDKPLHIQSRDMGQEFAENSQYYNRTGFILLLLIPATWVLSLLITPPENSPRWAFLLPILLSAIPSCVYFYRGWSDNKKAKENFQFYTQRQLELENKALEWWMPMQQMSHEYRRDLLLEESRILSETLSHPHQLLMKAMELPGQLLLVTGILKAENKYEKFRALIDQANVATDAMMKNIFDSNLNDEEKTAQALKVAKMIADLTQRSVNDL